MRHSHYTLSARSVASCALQWLLNTFQWTTKSAKVTPKLLVQLLLRAATERRSLSAVVGESQNAPAWETVRTNLFACLPDDPHQLAPTVSEALHARLPKSLRKRPRTMAVDFHLRPYYGHKKTKGIYRGAAEAGTHNFFAFATLLVLRRGQSFTVALTPVKKGEEQTDVLARLIWQAGQEGLKVRRLLLDRGFYAATTMVWLQQQGIAFVMPMIRRGKKGRTKAQSTGTAKFFVPRRRGWDRYTFTSRPRRGGKKQKGVTVSFDVCIVPRSQHRSKKRGPLVFACHQISWSAKEVAKRYRHRFGIETSYRQLGESLVVTCSKNRSYRLLLVLIALVLRNLWVWLHWQHLSVGRGEHRQLRLELLRLRKMTRWIMWVLDRVLQMQPVDITIENKTTNARGAS